MLIDLHTHIYPGSHDSSLSLAELVQQAKRVGLDAVCITNHDSFCDAEALSLLSRENGLLVLPGAEINTEYGEFVVFGPDKYVSGMHRAESLKRMVDEAGGAMILAHPYRRLRYSNSDPRFEPIEQTSQNPALRLADAIEILNGNAVGGQNELAQKLCHFLNLKGVGASDAHYASDIPSYATLFDRRISNLRELIEELKAGRFRAVDIRPGR